MRSGSAVVQNEEEKKKYHIYVEEYVLSYLRREADSLELSEIYFYGSRQENDRKIFVYGAGRDKEIEAFAQYEPLSELVCRLTQAGPVFMIREPNGECNVNGFEVFYENNEAMQSYLLEWTGSADKKQDVDNDEAQTAALPILVSPEEKPQKEAHGAISIQLCLILMVLTAIVVTSTDSYDKMQQLNQSAKEVFFAIENQEAEDTAEDMDRAKNENEIVVERDVTADREPAEQTSDAEPAADADRNLSEMRANPKLDEEQEDSTEAEEEPEESILEPVQDKPSEEPEDQKQDAVSGEEEEQEQQDQDTAETEEKPEEGEEALSRSVTRYYEVEQGDTLYTISRKIYGDFSRVEKICEVNQITDPDKIRSGQRIILP